MKKAWKYPLGAIILVCVATLAILGTESEGSQHDLGDDFFPSWEEEVIMPGHSISDTLSFDPESPWYKTYQIEVPAEAFGIRLSLDGSSADLDIFINYGEGMSSYEAVSASSALGDYNENLFLSRLYDPPLQTGIYYVDVAYQGNALPRRNGRILWETSFELTYEVISTKIAGSLTPNKKLTSTLLPEEGMMKIFTIEVPRGTKALRVDVFDTQGDLDFLVNREQIAFNLWEADFVANWQMGRESAVLRNHPEDPLNFGLYYVTVFDQIVDDAPEDFSISVSLSEKPADFLTELPFLVVPENPMEKALLSTLEIITKGGTGSGCLVSEGGLVLTNWHVIRGASGLPEENIYGAVTLNSAEPPAAIFQMEMLDYDENKDIALLRITRGRYGQALPFSYRFPYYKLGDSTLLVVGQPLVVIGYPGIGGTGSRSTISVTRGIVSGFEKTFYGRIIKTDAQLNSGNSGGAAINTFYELVGIPTSVVHGEMGQMGFIYPIDLLPSKWVRLIEND